MINIYIYTGSIFGVLYSSVWGLVCSYGEGSNNYGTKIFVSIIIAILLFVIIIAHVALQSAPGPPLANSHVTWFECPASKNGETHVQAMLTDWFLVGNKGTSPLYTPYVRYSHIP